MLDIESFYRAASNGEYLDDRGIADFIRGFDNVILWGAGGFGKAIGRKLKQMNVHVSAYWDRRAAEIKFLEGIRVDEPFPGNLNPQNTLVVACITNGSTGGQWTIDQLQEHGYHNFLIGQKIFEGLICPVGKGAGFNEKACLDFTMCNECACDRFLNLVYAGKTGGETVLEGEPLLFNVVTFIVNQKCSLGCKHCGQYMNSYPRDKRVNFPKARIMEDINKFFDAVDTIGVVSIIGGEAFLHPDLGEIVELVLGKKNFGVINVTTNGIFRIAPNKLDVFKNSRIKISFSDYTANLSQSHKDRFEKNVSLVQSKGINFTIGVPVWVLPGSLRMQNHAMDAITSRKAACGSIKMSMSVKNGKFFPCSPIETIHCLGIADYASDCVDLEHAASSGEIREAIRTLINRPYYQSCFHCGDESGLLESPGEQDKDGRYIC